MQDKKNIIYITGVPGTGKTTLTSEFLKMGYFAIDLDEFSHWEHKESKERNNWFPGASRDFLENHEWVCDLGALKKVINEHADEDVFVFGVMDSRKEAFSVFDMIILLQISTETAFKRVDLRNNNDFGKGNIEKEWIKSWKDGFEKGLIEKGAIVISAEEPIGVILNKILAVCKT